MTQRVGTMMANYGLDLNIYDKYMNTLAPNMVDMVRSYNHTINSFGGFADATVQLIMPKIDAEWWYEHALGTRVRLTCQAGRIAWEGFVNVVSISAGSESQSRGPLLDLCNHLTGTYAPIDYSVNPPTVGSEITLGTVTDATSIATYGQIEKWLGIGGCTPAMALYALYTALYQMAYPRMSGQTTLSGNKNVAVTLKCLGKVNWLNVYTYDLAVAGNVTATAKLLAVLAADPNAFLSTDYTLVYANAIAVNAAEFEHRYALDIIKELQALGDYTTIGTRTLFGVYENAQVQYQIVPSTIAYRHYLTWPKQAVTDLSEAVVPPWLVRPGKWLMVPDFQPRLAPQPLNQDPRTKFIESVRYSAPNSLDLSGGKLDNLSALLALITYSAGMIG